MCAAMGIVCVSHSVLPFLALVASRSCDGCVMLRSRSLAAAMSSTPVFCHVKCERDARRVTESKTRAAHLSLTALARAAIRLMEYTDMAPSSHTRGKSGFNPNVDSRSIRQSVTLGGVHRATQCQK